MTVEMNTATINPLTCKHQKTGLCDLGAEHATARELVVIRMPQYKLP